MGTPTELPFPVVFSSLLRTLPLEKPGSRTFGF